MSLCLARIPGASGAARDYARRAAAGLPAVAEISPEAAAALRPVVQEAERATVSATG